MFRVVEFGPGVSPRNHRTHSIDYAVVMSGQIDMDLDGTVVTLRQGDVLVQRGTIHNWINRYNEPCVIAFALIDAKPVEVGGKRLDAHGYARARRDLTSPASRSLRPRKAHRRAPAPAHPRWCSRAAAWC